MMENSASDLEKITGSARHGAVMQIPQLHRLLESPQAQQLCIDFGREATAEIVRGAVACARQAALKDAVPLPDFFSQQFFDGIRENLLRRHEPRLMRVINATGVVLHTNLGRAPLASKVVAEISKLSAGYCNLEFDLDQGERGTRYAHVETWLCQLTGAESSIVVNNCAAAVLLALSAFAKDAEVVVSRGELIEIGGSFRMQDVIAQSGARLVEVGSTNKTHLADYEKAVSEQTRVLLKSHPSNYRIVGFCSQPERHELAALARREGLIFMEDLGSGSLVDLRRFGLPHEPTVQECVQNGADLVMFSGDKLLGGPQAGIILGKAKHIEVLKKHPLLRAVRIDKLALAALEATLRLYLSKEPPEQHVPVLRMLAETKESVTRRARKLARELNRIPRLTCWTEDGYTLPGGGSLPEAELPTCLVKFQVAGLSVNRLAKKLRQHRPPLVGRIAEDCFVLDLRTVAKQEGDEIIHIIRHVIE